MTLPRWDDPALKAGTRIRSALWLISEVGLGNSFTKERHRSAFSGVAQADRRLRDLRDYGWVIHTSVEDVTLNPDEQRFVRIGSPVWERGVRKDYATKGLTPKMRRAAFAESDYQCIICGIAAGERYLDAPHMTAVLDLSRRIVTDSQGEDLPVFMPECERCRSGGTSSRVIIPALVANVNNLDPGDRAVFMRWIERGRRSALDRLWADFRRLPTAARADVCKQLKQ